ncbi:hypothetical protein NCC78_11290 [Micromonospora phytophila]|uniref:hypothetical protein n=1 Tax=Micromonospora phytophila TaxID=709888 RepID=UPI00203069D5|nr:hypothetical protein [Micromonospora phytophila]MCM0675265.1 hypothetical protein [Micromonospora phytophila]
MGPDPGRGLDGIWRIGPIRLLVVVAIGYLAVVLVLAAVTSDLDLAPSTATGGSAATLAATDVSASSVPQDRDASSAPPATPVGAAEDVRIGSLGTRPAAPPSAPPPAPPPATRRPTTPAAPPVVTSYEAESSGNGLNNIKIYACPGCSGGKKVGNIGRDMGTLQFNGVTARTGGSATVTITYVNGEGPRVGQVSVNGAAAIRLTFPGTGGWSSVGTMVVTVSLRPGPNTLKMFNPDSAAPDFDKITVSVR